MAEFKFSCPQCKQSIQCDVRYAGLQINCPVCQQTIVVPPAPPTTVATGDPAIHIKISTLKKAGVILAGVVLAAMLVAITFYLFVGTRSATFKAYVDGTDIVKLRDRTLWIEHQAWQTPNKVTVNGKKWNPTWDGNTSAPYSLGWMFRPVNPKNLKLTTRLGRGSVTILEKPTPENEQTLSVKVDDGPFGGADWYEFTVSW